MIEPNWDVEELQVEALPKLVLGAVVAYLGCSDSPRDGSAPPVAFAVLASA